MLPKGLIILCILSLYKIKVNAVKENDSIGPTMNERLLGESESKLVFFLI